MEYIINENIIVNNYYKSLEEVKHYRSVKQDKFKLNQIYKSSKLWSRFINETNAQFIKNLKLDTQVTQLNLYDRNHDNQSLDMDAMIWLNLEADIKREILKDLGLSSKQERSIPLLTLQHENKHNQWLSSLQKSMYVNTPYKYLITYSDKTFEDEVSFKQTLLKMLNDQAVDVIPKEDDCFIFTFGKRYHKDDTNLLFKSFAYRYRYDEENKIFEFSEIFLETPEFTLPL